ncbi:hypothetical protein [Geoglobus ahangari]
MPAVKILSALPAEEIRELLREVLDELGVDYSESESGFTIDSGKITIREAGKTSLGLTLNEITIPEERIAKRFRERLMSKRAGG